jgi:hypothetical protein
MTEQTDAAEEYQHPDVPVPASWWWTEEGRAKELAAREAAARAEALREAADAWTQGAWSDVMLPKPTPPAVPVIAYSNRMGDWLRDRAASIARTDGAGS